jgi:hypothetical protein
MKDQHFHRATDSVDAAVFSGDVLHDKEDRAEFRECCLRWLRAIEEAKRDDEQDEADKRGNLDGEAT